MIKASKKASVLVYALIIVSIASVILFGLVQFVVSNVLYSLHAQPKEQSLQVAESGVYFYRWYLAHNVEGKTATQITEFWNGDPIGVDDNGDGDCDDADSAPDNYDANGDGNIDSNDSDGTEAYVSDYENIGQFKICVTPPEEYSTIVSITASGWINKKPDLVRTARARLRKPSWSENTILANAFIRLSSGTEIYGPIHANEGFHFDGTAHNLISSSVETYYDSDSDVQGTRPGVWRAGSESVGCSDPPDAGEQAHFLAGKKCPVTAQDFNNVSADFNVMRDAAQAASPSLYWNAAGKGRLIELGVPSANQMTITRVKQYNNDTYAITELKNNDQQVRDIPDIGVAYVQDNVWVEGTLPSGKRLTIVAHNNAAGQTPRIFLGRDDVLYESYTGGDTVLGLAAEGDVTFVRDSKNTLRIDAAILSQSGRLGWDFSYAHPACAPNSLCDKTQITIYGAIATNERMGFGYTDGSGFDTRKLIFDNHLLFTPPPLFPTGSSYQIDLWEEIK